MVVDEKRPISMAEVVDLVGDSEKSESIKSFIKNFEVIPLERAMKIKEGLEALDLIRLKDYHIVKIIDFMPGDATVLNKVVNDASFEQEEVDKILDVIKNN